MSIILRHVHKTYDTNTVLEDVSVTFGVHEKVALVGENGEAKPPCYASAQVQKTQAKAPSHTIPRDGYGMWHKNSR